MKQKETKGIAGKVIVKGLLLWLLAMPGSFVVLLWLVSMLK